MATSSIFHNVIIDTPEKLNEFAKALEQATDWVYKNNICKTCRCHPRNGGSGICNCILGQPKIT